MGVSIGDWYMSSSSSMGGSLRSMSIITGSGSSCSCIPVSSGLRCGRGGVGGKLCSSLARSPFPSPPSPSPEPEGEPSWSEQSEGVVMSVSALEADGQVALLRLRSASEKERCCVSGRVEADAVLVSEAVEPWVAMRLRGWARAGVEDC